MEKEESPKKILVLLIVKQIIGIDPKALGKLSTIANARMCT